MWVIVAVSLTVGDAPKLTIVPGAEFQSESECVRATRVHADFDSQGGGLHFTVCLPKDSVQIGN
jgi:hypothetical protein